MGCVLKTFAPGAHTFIPNAWIIYVVRMKNWQRYRQYLKTGDFHVHTDHTEGMNSVDELCEQAVMNGLKLIAFTEHVRKTLSYDYNALLSDIKEARERYPDLVILPGCEAAVRDREGSLDVSEEVLGKAEIVVASFHDFPYGHKEDFLRALRGMLRNPMVDIWGHPATFLRNVTLTGKELEEIIMLCKERDVLIEDSLARAYPTPPGFLEKVRELGATTVTDSDAHCRDDLKKIAP